MAVDEGRTPGELLRWEAETEKAALEGIPKRDWPQKPVRGRKPKLSDIIPAEEQRAGEDDDDGDEEEEMQGAQ